MVAPTARAERADRAEYRAMRRRRAVLRRRDDDRILRSDLWRRY